MAAGYASYRQATDKFRWIVRTQKLKI